jgi:recombination protein RecA
MYGTGISRIGELIDLSVENEIIQKSGSWMSYKGEKIGQGRDAVKAYLEANPVIGEAIMVELKSKLLLINEEKRAK